jgi:limonene-1,2-epoxide hydrolase
MAEHVSEQFVEALGKLEAGREVEAIVGIFSDNCEVGNIISPEKFHGREGARKFRTKYRDTFGEVRSTFRNVITTDGHAALEWTTEGASSGCEPIRYDGVSILETEGARIVRFRAYFDAGDLGRQVQKPG